MECGGIGRGSDFFQLPAHFSKSIWCIPVYFASVLQSVCIIKLLISRRMFRVQIISRYRHVLRTRERIRSLPGFSERVFCERNELAKNFTVASTINSIHRTCSGLSRIAFLDGNGVVMLGKIVTCERKVDGAKKK